MASERTADHETIRSWVEERGGRPARLKGTGNGDDAGLLRSDYPGRDDSLEEIALGEWSDAFEENRLAFLYQDETAEGEESRFSKLITR